MDLLDQMLEHDRWATEQLLDASQGLTDAELDREFDVGHRTLRATFAHMIFNYAAWTALMTGQPAAEPRADASLTALADAHERDYAAFADLARRLRDGQRLEDTFIDHYDVTKSFGGTILMAVLHNTEHRTEAQHILARLGVPEVPEVDLGLWEYERLAG